MTHRSAQEILLVVHDERLRKLVAETLQGAGYAVTPAGTAAEALARAAEAAPELVIAEVAPLAEGLGLLRRLRAEPTTGELPVIALVAEDAGEGVVASLQAGADDGLALPLDAAELLARIRTRLERPPVPRELLPQDPQTGLLSERCFFEEVARELVRARSRRAPGCLACLELAEVAGRRQEGGARAQAEITRQMTALLPVGAGALELAGRDAEGRILLLLPRESARAARKRLEQLCRQITDHRFAVRGEPVRLTPVVGYAPLGRSTKGDSEPASARGHLQALAALDAARRQLAAHPVQYSPALAARALAPSPSPEPARRGAAPGRMARAPLQALLTFLAAPVLPLLHSVAWGRRD